MKINDDSGFDKESRCNVVATTGSEVGKFNLGDFTELVLMEIIRRLPVKSIFRSKCVCRQWFSLISDPNFALFYVSGLSPLLKNSLWAKIFVPRISSGLKTLPFAFVSGEMQVYSPDQVSSPANSKQLHDDDFPGDLESKYVYSVALPSTQQPGKDTKSNYFRDYEIVAIHLDLVLYITHDDHICQYYYICNPFTGQWIALPPPSQTFRWFSSGFVAQVEDGILMSYTVVRFKTLLEINTINFEVFTSETGEWKSFDIHVDRMIRLPLCERPTSLNGILHWRLDGKDEILSYDPHKHPQKYRIIPLPKDDTEVNNDQPSYHSIKFCAAHRGCLVYVEFSESFDLNNKFQHIISVWKLNNYNTGEWCLKHKVCGCDILPMGLGSVRSFDTFTVGLDPFSGDDVLYLGGLICVLSYNFRTRELKAHGTQISWNPNYWGFVFLLMPMPTPTLIPLPVT